jgi:hypothetical protein
MDNQVVVNEARTICEPQRKALSYAAGLGAGEVLAAPNIERFVVASLSPIDLARGILDGALQQPWNALAQVTGDRLPAMHLVGDKDQSLARKAGNIAGSVIDLLILSRLTGKATSSLFQHLPGVLASGVKFGMDGAIYGGIFTQSDNNKGLLRGRLQNAAINGLTFAAMGSTSHVFQDEGVFGATSLKTEVLRGALYGGIGGTTHAFAQAAINDHRLAKLPDTLKDALSYAAFGGIFGATHRLLENVRLQPLEKISGKSEVSDQSQAMADRASDRIGKWYGLIEPRLAIHLTDPNVVLTLADARGQTEFFVETPKPGDLEALERLNAVTESDDVHFKAAPIEDCQGNPTLIVSVVSFRGLENTTRASNLPGVSKYNAAEGLHGYYRFGTDSIDGVRIAQQNGLYGTQQVDPVHVVVGVNKGYPDEAILSLMRTPREELLATNIPYADCYDCAQPNYMYDLRAADSVDGHAQTWGEILRSFYQSGQHRNIATQDQFIEARQESQNARAVRIGNLLSQP